MEDTSTATTVYIYGPPASGKLTIAQELAALTGWGLFHNHLTVNALRSVLPFGTEPFRNVLHRLRLDVFSTAAAAGLNVIFTNNSAWSGGDGRERFVEFANETEARIVSNGGRIAFVRITAPEAVLEERIANESRRLQAKLLDVGRLRELTCDLDDSSLHADDLVVDSSTVEPAGAAALIANYLTAVTPLPS